MPFSVVPFAEDETCIEVGTVEAAQFLDRDRPVVELALLCGIVTLCDPAELNARFLPCRLRCPYTVQPNRVATRAAKGTILQNVAALARPEDAQAEARQLVVPDHIILVLCLGGIHHLLAELPHGHTPVIRPFLA